MVPTHAHAHVSGTCVYTYNVMYASYNALLTQFKDRIHGLKEPLIVRGKPLGQLGDPSNQVRANVLIPCLSKVGN